MTCQGQLRTWQDIAPWEATRDGHDAQGLVPDRAGKFDCDGDHSQHFLSNGA